MADAVNNETTWSRDSVADANPELTRKRQKLSEEVDDTNAETSSLSTAQSPEIVALPPDEVGATYHNAIELHDETGLSMDFSFGGGPDLSPGSNMSSDNQLKECVARLHKGQALEPDWVAILQQWLHGHLEQTRNLSDVWQQAYTDETELFTCIITFAHMFFAISEDRFADDLARRFGIRPLRRIVEGFFVDIAELSTRLVTILPRILDSAVARRDSGQIAQTRQFIPFLGSVHNLVQAVQLYNADLAYFDLALDVKPADLRLLTQRSLLQDPAALPALTTLLEKLAVNHVAVQDAWPAIDSILRMLSTMGLEDSKQLEKVLDTIHTYILPAIGEKHPRALPDGFHFNAIMVASRALAFLAKTRDDDGVASLYNVFIKSESDALLVEADGEISIARLLRNLSNGDQETLVALMRYSYVLQALKQLVFSEIMDVRNTGISQLSLLLLKLFKQNQNGNCEKPVLQYAARFMRKNEMTKYIFGPNSHATLISHSQNIIGFLAATCTYTDLDTDVIWHACTNSVEAEFSKASFLVLSDVRRYLDLDHLLYLANKFTVTPPSKLGRDAADLLRGLFEIIQPKTELCSDPEKRLATAFISIDIMSQIDIWDNDPLLMQLRTTASLELQRFTSDHFTAEDRLQIFKRCVPNILEANERASTSAEILTPFVHRLADPAEAPGDLLNMLPLHAVLRELSMFVNRVRDDSTRDYRVHLGALNVRLGLLMRLMSLPDIDVGMDVLDTLAKYTIGELALNNHSRDFAWQRFSYWAEADGPGSIASDLLRRLLSEEAIHLPLEYTTRTSLRLFGSSLQEQGRMSPSLRNEFSQMLELPQWHKLVQAAESTDIPEIDTLATDALCNALFEHDSQNWNKTSVAKCHATFARQQIERICSLYASSSSKELRDGNGHIIIRQIALLDAVLLRSKHSSYAPTADVPLDLCLANKDSKESIFATMQVYGGGQPHTKICRLQYTATSTVAELLAELPKITGAAENRVILGGQALDLTVCANKELSEIGLHSTGVIIVCPKHTLQSDLEVVLTSSGAVEEEILAQYDHLERLIDGPAAIANQMFQFLTHVRVPAQPRDRVVSTDLSVQDLCPPDNKWRTLFSVFVLKTHLTDFARLGVAEETFLLRGIHLLVEVITDKMRPKLFRELISTMECLVSFLQERPKEAMTSCIIDDAARFTDRMIDICFLALSLPSGQRAERRILLEMTMKTLVEAFRRQNSVWTIFKIHPRTNELHKQMLFHDEVAIASFTAKLVKSFVLDHTSDAEVAELYMGILMGCLEQALKTPSHSFVFDLTTDLMLVNRKLRNNEEEVRALLTTLLDRMWAHRHTESVDLPVPDMAMRGLLKLIYEVLTVVRSFKKPLGLDGLSLRIFTTLLFPPLQFPDSHPLISSPTRKFAFYLVESACESSDDFEALLEATGSVFQIAPDPHDRYPGHSEWLRPAAKCSGLTNLGMTCYMNSLLQQLYGNVHFRKFIFDTELVDPEKQELLSHVQNLFAHMQNDYNWTSATNELAKVLNVQVDSQEDVHGFYEDFLSKLEASMPDEVSKTTLKGFFTGKLISQIKGECGHVSPKTEPFVDLPIIVKNKASLQDSLQEFVQGEPMEGANKYKCMACDADDGGRLVNAMKRACPEEMPDNLTFCLKRFTFEAMLGIDGKVNDRFDFPQSIDMSRYHRKHLDNPEAEIDMDVFELVGVIVHQGTLNLGHYWSYVLLRNTGHPDSRNWVKLEDRFVSPVEGGVQEVQGECFGGQFWNNGNERVDNAYVLFYQRKTSLEEQIALPGPVWDSATGMLLPPKVDIPERLRTEIHGSNEFRNRVAQLFDDQLDAFMRFLFTTYRKHSVSSPAQSETGSQEADEANQAGTVSRPGTPSDHLIKLMSNTAIAYVQHVAVADSAGAVKPKWCFEQLRSLIEQQPRSALYLLDDLTTDVHWFRGVVGRNSNTAVRALVCEFIMSTLHNVHEQDWTFYRKCVDRLLTSHAEVKELYNAIDVDWAQYLGFAAELAALGPAETASVLDKGYLTWAWEMLRVTGDPQLKAKYPGLSDHIKQNSSKVTALFVFIHAILDGHTSFPDMEPTGRSEDEGVHLIRDDGTVQLHQVEVQWFFRRNGHNQEYMDMWLLHARHARNPSAFHTWPEFPPGKLLRLYMDPDKSPIRLREAIDEGVLYFVEQENQNLNNMLHVVLSYTSLADQHNAARVFGSLTRNIHDWEGDTRELDFVRFARKAMDVNPAAFVAHLQPWLVESLCSKSSTVCEHTEKFLKEYVFAQESNGDVLTDNATLNFNRLRAICDLVKPLRRIVEDAWQKERARKYFEHIIRILKEAELWLQDLYTEASALIKAGNADGTVDTSMKVELGELPRRLRELHNANSEFADWDADDVAELPGIGGGMRHGSRNGSVRLSMESDEDVESSGEEEDEEGWDVPDFERR
ncbi:unnamed protein product [Zymoseptoria tritici ST99CH_3D7]|uniref:USP domain-containing protein n=1 Tax=Zymoseptoria tritici (strain ST99CH_3D7) TaxID=1276538 RepID=A0A1X7RPG1_ZYMT9|nr:unnamed protein product [Zymoseptoria tritici ST99CH_3D7]